MAAEHPEANRILDLCQRTQSAYTHELTYGIRSGETFDAIERQAHAHRLETLRLVLAQLKTCLKSGQTVPERGQSNVMSNAGFSDLLDEGHIDGD